MDVHEKITMLEKKVEQLEQVAFEEYVTPKQLAERLQCSTNHVYVQIRQGKIKVLSGLGSCIRIPMSQFKDNRKNTAKDNIKKDQLDKDIDIEDVRDWVWG